MGGDLFYHNTSEAKDMSLFSHFVVTLVATKCEITEEIHGSV